MEYTSELAYDIYDDLFSSRFKQTMEQSKLKALSTFESTCAMKCDVYIREELNADVVLTGGTDSFSPKRHEV